ncbi:MAG: ABC1 kinase family protein [Sandaracinaceae bacterium]
MTESRSLLGVAVRDVSRLQKVTTTIARHGFGEVLRQMPFGAQLVGRGRGAAGKEAEGSAPERFTRLLAALGPTYIKLGQVLSMRADLLPPEYIQALASLQDRAPVLDAATVRAAVQAGLGQPVDALFRDFDDEPLGTASIAQTHLATTRSGQRVVVKVQRPGIGDVMRGDLDLLYLFARGLEAGIEELRLIEPSAIVAEFEHGLLRELNFAAELSHLVRARELLDPARPVTVPAPLPELSSRTVLTMELFRGRPLRELTPGTDEARAAVEHVLHAMCKGVFVDGFFHADPHPGNLLVNDEGVVCLVDLGLVGTLSPEQRQDLTTLVLGTLVNDASTVARVLLKMGTPTQRVDIGELKREIVRIRARYVMVRALEEVDTQGFVEDLASAVGRFRVKLATEYALLVKAGGTLEGLVRRLHPTVDLLALTTPYVERMVGERWAPSEVLQQALGGSVGVASLLRTLPTHVDQILHDFETGNVQVRPLTPSLDRLPDIVYQSATRSAVALFSAATTIAGAVALPGDYREPMDWVRIGISVALFTLAAGGWTVTWWWHWLGRQRSLRLTPLLRLFRRGRR